MKFKRGISLALALAIIAGMGGPLDIRAAAADAGSSDALAALGIDSSKAPDGFNANDTSNPYGRNTIKVTPVYELYTVGLTSDVLPSDTINMGSTADAESCAKSTSESNTKDNKLQSTLYGNDDNKSTKAQDFLTAQKQNKTISEGKTTSTGNYAQFPVGSKNGDSYNTKGYLTGMTNASTKLDDKTDYAMADVAAGHFTNSEDAKSEQVAMVYAGDLSANGGLYLRFGDAESGKYGNPITLLDTSKAIGNPTLKDNSETVDGQKTEEKLVENFAENPYQLKNYLQVATGDWDNDGTDEVAVYVPEVGNSRIEIYDLQSGEYSNSSNWRQAWTYYFYEGNVVSNMISLVSGDVNQDGVDDLACTWGYYYGPQQNAGSRAVVMFGSTSAHMLQSSQEFPLTYEGSNLVRASFAFGDMTGGGKTLILAAQSDADLKAGKQNTRYVGLYAWNGVTFKASTSKNFDLFSKDDKGKYIYSAMADHNDTFRSLPLCPANTAIISRPTAGEIDKSTSKDGKNDNGKTSDLLYFDSLVISCDENGLNIKQALDNTKAMPDEDYVEYDASAGAVTTAVDKDNNTSGSGTLFTLTQTMAKDTEHQSDSYTVKGKVPTYETRYYYKSWWHKLFRKKSSYIAFTGYKEVDQAVQTPYNTRTPGTTTLSTVNLFDGSQPVQKPVNSSYTLCLANTDDDTSYMTYTGNHYYTYSDPQVLAVLASPPYFSDLLDRDDLSGNYAESSTTYSTTKGTENGTTSSSTISVGAYVSFEQEFSVFGVKIGSVEAEAAFTSGFTYETEHTSSLEQSITYETTSGEDRVAFYSIPMEIYEYTSYIPDGKGNYDAVKSTVSIPHEASIGLIDLSDYEDIAEDYSVLPSISGNVLTHTIGDPSSYPSKPDAYANAKAYEGAPAKVDFTAAGGGSTITQEISFSTSDSKAYTNTTSIETKAGAGAGGVTAGVIAGSEKSAGTVSVNTAGGSFSGSLQNMPIEAKEYGYGMNWRIFCYNYRSGNQAFPVVTYAVTEPQAPSPLPEDFEQDVAETTDDSVTLTWTYDKIVSGFQLYRYYNFPDGSGRKELAFVPFTEGERDDKTGTYTFSYTDNNLSPYTEYEYQIQTCNNNKAQNQRKSIYSEPLTCLTKTTAGYPDISVNIDGKDNQTVLPIYPDTQATATVSYKEPDGGKYNSVNYQWQKLDNGSWTDLPGSKTKTLTIENAGSADKGTYRCRLNVLYFDNTSKDEYSISAYSPEITTAYSKRTPKCELNVTAENVQVGGTTQFNRTLHINATMSSASATSSIPTGTLSFLIRGTDFSTTVGAKIGDNGVASTDVIVPADGAYTVTPYYPGSYVFKDMSSAEGKMVLVGDATGYQLTLTNGKDSNSVTRFTYGEAVTPLLSRMTKDSNGLEKINATFKYAVSGSKDEPQALEKNNKLDVGTYTLYAYVNGEKDPVAETEFTVVPRAVTLRVVTPKDGVDQALVDPQDKTQLSLTADTKNMSETEIAKLKFGYTAVNSAGNTVTLKPNIPPSNYTVSPCKTADTSDTLYNNYEFTFIPGVYTVNGTTYVLTLKAADFGEGANKHSVGSASIITAGLNAGKADDGSVISSFTANTDVTLTATPDAGYAVDYWTYDGKKIEDSSEKNSVTIKTLAKPASVVVYFKSTDTTLNASIYKDAGGTLKCTNQAGNETLDDFPAYIASGAKYVFTATPDTGWHFKQWILTKRGANSYPDGTKDNDGSNTLSVEVGVQDINLVAVFERDSYTLTLDGELTASYQTVDPDDTSKTLTKSLKDGDSVTGDTQITVAPKAGYVAAKDETYKLNDKAVSNALNADGSYTFPITENTKVSLKTDRADFAITTPKMEHGKIVATVDGEAVDDLSKIPGGSKVELQARAERGWHFDHWVVNDKPQDETKAKTNGTYTISELAGDLTISAEFAQSDSYTAKATAAAGNGTVEYTLYDIYGEEVETKTMPTTGVTIYKDEEITFHATPKAGYQVEQWEVNGKKTAGNSETNPEGRIHADKDITATVHFKVSANYMLTFGTADTNGSLTAKIDDTAVTSQTKQPNGSAITFTAVPNANKMVEKWTVTKGTISTAENDAAVQADGVDLVDPVYVHTLSGNQTIRVHFTDLVQYNATITGTNGTGQFTYTTPIQPSDNGAIDKAATQVRKNGTVKLTLKPSANCVGTAEEIKTVLEAAAPNAVVDVTEKDGSFEAVIRNVTAALTVNTDNLFHKTYAITASKAENGSVTASAARAKAGDKVTLTAAPASGYQLKTLTLAPETALDKTVSASTLTYTFTMPESDVTVTATFAAKPSSGGGAGGAGGAGGGGAVAPAPSDNGSSAITAPDGTKVPATVTVKDGTAAVSADISKLTTVSGKDSLTLDLSTDSTVRTVSLTGDVVTALASAKNGVSLTLPNGTVALDRETLTALGSAAQADGTASISIDSADKSSLTDAQRKYLPKNGVILNISAQVQPKNGTVTRIHELNGTASVSVAYSLKSGETASHLVAYYLAEDGSFEKLPVTYDAATGKATFKTAHFSTFVITHEYSSDFSDVTLRKWFYNEVNTALESGWFKGLTATKFGPDYGMTRAMLVQVLYRMSGSKAASTAQFTDVADGKWYAEAIAWASENGIVNGFTDGRFQPDTLITRQQLAAILYRYDTYCGHTPQGNAALDGYADAASVESWAAEAMSWANGNGLVTGVTPTTLVPNGTATRAQVAVILSRYTGK